jgi:3-oxoacyl-[acyl-carrier protein] reductase
VSGPAMSRAVAAAVDAFGGVDVIVSNAGAADRTPAADLTEARLEAAGRLAQGALLGLARSATPHLAAGDAPRIIAVSSFVAHVFRPDLTLFPATAAAKAGLEALVKTLALELAPRGVAVNAVAPGFTEKDARAHSAMTPEQWAAVTAKIPLRRLAKPADIANAIAFLARPESGYITGQTLHVNGGLWV